MQFSAVLNMFIVKTYLNSIFTNDLKRKENFRKMFKVTEYAALRPLWHWTRIYGRSLTDVSEGIQSRAAGVPGSGMEKHLTGIHMELRLGVCVFGVGGGSKPDWRLSRHLLIYYRVFQLTIPRELKFPRREGESNFRCCEGRV